MRSPRRGPLRSGLHEKLLFLLTVPGETFLVTRQLVKPPGACLIDSHDSCWHQQALTLVERVVPQLLPFASLFRAH
jgi:hypothetical protein